MFCKISDLKGHTIEATDGPCGECWDFYFDQDDWTVRHLVVKTGGFLTRHEVLLSPFSVIRDEDLAHPKRIRVDLTRDQIEQSPDISTDAPVSRMAEAALARYFQHPFYWIGNELWGTAAYPLPPSPSDEQQLADELAEAREAKVRSADEVIGYQVNAAPTAEGPHVGTVTDMIMETASWRIRYLVVETGNWLHHDHVLIAPEWVGSISWSDKAVRVSEVSREQIEKAPVYDVRLPLTREFEAELYAHYGKPPWWRD